jgi:hypothetical protein
MTRSAALPDTDPRHHTAIIRGLLAELADMPGGHQDEREKGMRRADVTGNWNPGSYQWNTCCH